MIVPIPTTIYEWVWTLLGATFGRAFGKRLDQGIQGTIWFIGLPGYAQSILKRILDFTHHWWVGLLVTFTTAYGPYLIAWQTPDVRMIGLYPCLESFWFGIGLFADDARDFNQIKKRFQTMMQKVRG